MFRWHAMPFWIWGRSRPMVGKLVSSWINILSTACSHLKMNHTFKSLQTCPVNMLDPIHWSLGYSQLWPAYSQNQARLNKLCKTSPDPIWMAWYWPNRSGPKASWCARISRSSSGRMQLTCYQFPTFRLICVLPQTAQIILCKTSMDPIWFWLCQILAKWIWSRVQESSRADSLVFSFRCWIATGMVYL